VVEKHLNDFRDLLNDGVLVNNNGSALSQDNSRSECHDFLSKEEFFSEAKSKINKNLFNNCGL
jgi:hypothetical protein